MWVVFLAQQKIWQKHTTNHCLEWNNALISPLPMVGML